ncbi:hypothetical protein BB559_003215 [Furculomyces boomerangus]|uniref:Cytochrome b5 heme-binding domain-containing protein n=1 Tax=Furculomyces boomerangus TaxID=61424 RepID=A0A2T9YMQ9_9FUNG|nr:hypothetical protein BB559_003215 [Furculomyces boomerangus]
MFKSEALNLAAISGIIIGLSLIAGVYLNPQGKSSSKSKGKSTGQEDPEDIKKNKYTKRDISKFTGENPDEPILIAVKGIVYDVNVNNGGGYYGPSGPYSLFSGRDASRLFSLFEFDNGMTEAEINAPIDPLDNLTAEEEESLEAYIQLFESKYKPVGILVEPHEK